MYVWAPASEIFTVRVSATPLVTIAVVPVIGDVLSWGRAFSGSCTPTNRRRRFRQHMQKLGPGVIQARATHRALFRRQDSSCQLLDAAQKSSESQTFPASELRQLLAYSSPMLEMTISSAGQVHTAVAPRVDTFIGWLSGWRGQRGQFVASRHPERATAARLARSASTTGNRSRGLHAPSRCPAAWPAWSDRLPLPSPLQRRIESNGPATQPPLTPPATSWS